MVFFDHVIVGSGPAGVAAARQLENSNTCIVDVAQEPTSVFAHASLAQAVSSGSGGEGGGALLGAQWETMANLADPLRYHPKLRASALRHVMQGEAFDVIGASGQLLVRGRGSFAAGGMANAWGAQLLRYTQEDLAEAGDWPIEAADLAPYYTELEAHIGISGAIDDMHAFLGDTDNLQPPVQMVPASRHLLERYASTHKNVGSNGLRLGRPRLAVLTQPHLGRPAHDFGETEFFAPAGAGIYNPLHTLTELRQHGKIHYWSGHKLVSYSEQVDCVELELEVVKTQARIRIRTRHLMLGCGTVQTSRLVLLNKQQPGRTLPFVDHPPTLLPIFFPARLGAALPSQSYPIQLIGTMQSLGKRDMMSFYYPGGMLWSDLLPDIPLPLNAARAVLAAMMGGMLVAQIWEASKPAPGNRLSVDGEGNITIRYPERQQYSKLPVLLASLRRLGGFTLQRLASAPPPSWGFHHAATLPMRADPQAFETHIDGRLWDSQRVRVIDGSVLPSLPAKNHSLTIMANAARIAQAVKLCGY
jgi:choline dehydrogenase-like flavoprotein